MIIVAGMKDDDFLVSESCKINANKRILAFASKHQWLLISAEICRMGSRTEDALTWMCAG